MNLICKICGKENKGKDDRGILSHVFKMHKISSKEYYDSFYKKQNEGICMVCGKQTNFINSNFGYREHCSRSCNMLDPITSSKVKNSILKNFGVEHSGQISKHIDYMKNGGASYANSFVRNPSYPQVRTFKNCFLVLPNPILNYPVYKKKGKRCYSIDIADSRLGIAIEYDGSRFHQDKEKDYKRQKELEEEGWKVLRYKDHVPSKEKLLQDIQEVL